MELEEMVLCMPVLRKYPTTSLKGIESPSKRCGDSHKSTSSEQTRRSNDNLLVVDTLAGDVTERPRRHRASGLPGTINSEAASKN